MRAIIQRVKKASVEVSGDLISQIDKGFLVLLAVEVEDTEDDMTYILDKTLGLRVFEDGEGKMNLSLKDVEGELIIVSQFTLYGDVRKGKRPSFIKSAKGEKAERFYNNFVEKVRERGFVCKTGIFGADMQVSLINDGPVTIQLDSSKIY